MSIQSSVNQIIGSIGSGIFMASHLGQQSPAFRKMQEQRLDKKRVAALVKEAEARVGVTKEKLASGEATVEDIERHNRASWEAGDELVSLAEKRYKRYPSKKTYEEYESAIRHNTKLKADIRERNERFGIKQFDDAQADTANDRSFKQIDSALRIKDTMNRMRGLYNE